jgi:hypothetical protein
LAVQVDRDKPKLKLPRTKRLKLKCDQTAFKFCFQFELAPLHPGGVSAAAHSGGGQLGRTVQVDPMKPTLKAPVSMLLKLRYDGPVSSFAFKFNLRRHNSAWRKYFKDNLEIRGDVLAVVAALEELAAWGYTRPLFGST